MPSLVYRHLSNNSATIRFAIFLGFLIICFAGGGGSRADIFSLLYVRPAAIFCIAALLLLPGRLDWQACKTPLMILGGLALIMVIQIIPMPPSMWTRLPGHEIFVQAADVAGMAQPWRPISVTPDLTLNSLVALLVPAAALIGMASITREHGQLVLMVLIGLAVASGVLGIAQLAGGTGSSLYLYDITNEGSGVGLFSNRNHQAVLLAATLPMLALWASLPVKDRHYQNARSWIAAGIGLLILPMILVTGSRAGLLLGGLGILAGFFIFRPPSSSASSRRHARSRLSRAALAGAAVVIMAVFVLLSRATAVQRLVEIDALEEQRVSNLPLFIKIVADYFPFGAGFGSFDAVFRTYEPFDQLKISYLNHAHNDLLELLITGGALAGALLLVFLYWWIRNTAAAIKQDQRGSLTVAYARLGSTVIALLLLSSLVDYPLRTPSLAVVFAIACAWLGRTRVRPARQDREETSNHSSGLALRH